MPRHRNDSEIFRDLDFKGQAQSMNIACAQYRKKIDAHLELARAEGRDLAAVLRASLGPLRRIIRDYGERQ